MVFSDKQACSMEFIEKEVNMALKYGFLKVLLVFMIFELGAAFTAPLWTHFVEHLGGDVRGAGEAIFLYSIIFAIVGAFWSLLYERLPKKYYIYPLSLIFTALGFFCYSLISSIYELYVLQIYLGLVGSIQPVAFARIYENNFDNIRSVLPWGIYEASWLVVVGVGSLASAHLVYHYGFNVMFYCMTAISLLAVPVYFIVARNDII